MTSVAVLDRTVNTIDSMPADAPFVDSHLADAPLANGAHPHGFDRLVMRLSVATLLWAQRRAVKSSTRFATISFEEHRRRYLAQRELEAQSHTALRITTRLF